MHSSNLDLSDLNLDHEINSLYFSTLLKYII